MFNEYLKTLESVRRVFGSRDIKDLTFGFLFYKYLSEDLKQYVKELEDDTLEYAELSDEEAERFKEDIINEKGYFIYPSQIFENVIKDSSDNLTDRIKVTFKEIEESGNNKAFINIFDHIDLDSDDLGKTSLEREENLSKIIKMIDSFELESSDYPEFFDLLIQDFSIKTGKIEGEYATPTEISELLTLLAIENSDKTVRVYDPTLGTGSLILNISKFLPEEKIDGLYGQDINKSKYNLARMNMLIHNIEPRKINVALGDTLTEPIKWDDKSFDVIISNPPFGIHWPSKSDPRLERDERFGSTVLAPPNKGDLAFVMHDLAYLSEEGTAAVLCFPGILYRGGAEKTIRKYLVDNNFIDAIIQLPQNLLISTNIATCILVLKKTKTDENILFIDASDYFIKDKRKNKLSQEDIEKILKLFNERKDIEDVSELVTKEKIAEEDYNLSVSTYVDVGSKFKNSERLKDLIASIQMGSYRTVAKKAKSEEDNAYLININNLNNSIMTSTDNFSEVSTRNLKRTVELGDIIISRNLETFRGGLIEIVDPSKPLVSTSNTFIIKVDKQKIDPLYLLYILTSPIGKEQLEHRTPSSGLIRTVSATTLERLDLPVVNLDKQREIGMKYLKLLREKEEIEKSLENKIDEINTFVLDELK